MVVDDVEQFDADGDSAVLVALAADVQDTTVVGAPNVADVGAEELVGPETGQQRGEDDGPVTLGPVAVACGSAVDVDCSDQIGDGLGWVALRERLRHLRATNERHWVAAEEFGGEQEGT
jgi:hypothetical protein